MQYGNSGSPNGKVHNLSLENKDGNKIASIFNPSATAPFGAVQRWNCGNHGALANNSYALGIAYEYDDARRSQAPETTPASKAFSTPASLN